MQVSEVLERLGGVADFAVLAEACGRQSIRTAVAAGDVRRVGRGRYALPTASAGLRAAGYVSGHASHASAAAVHGWELARTPERPSVIVPRNRKVVARARRHVDIRYRDLGEGETQRFCTAEHRTVLDCARDLPFGDALAVADSALRHRAVDADRLLDLAAAVPTTGRRRALAVISQASPLAANPFESSLRAIALTVPRLNVKPQVLIDDQGFLGTPDLVDEERRLVLEADSFQFHASTRKQFDRDCERYNALVVRGWTVLRFTWQQVMFHPDRIRDLLGVAVGAPEGRAALTRTLLYTA